MAYKTPTQQQQKALEMADDLEKGIRQFMKDTVTMNRRASIAATHFETAFMYMRKAIMKEDNEL